MDFHILMCSGRESNSPDMFVDVAFCSVSTRVRCCSHRWDGSSLITWYPGTTQAATDGRLRWRCHSHAFQRRVAPPPTPPAVYNHVEHIMRIVSSDVWACFLAASHLKA